MACTASTVSHSFTIVRPYVHEKNRPSTMCVDDSGQCRDTGEEIPQTWKCGGHCKPQMLNPFKSDLSGKSMRDVRNLLDECDECANIRYSKVPLYLLLPFQPLPSSFLSTGKHSASRCFWRLSNGLSFTLSSLLLIDQCLASSTACHSCHGRCNTAVRKHRCLTLSLATCWRCFLATSI